MEWYAFTDRYPRAHLIVGAFDPRETVGRSGRFGVLGRLVISLTPYGEWAMMKVKRSGRTAIYVAYEKREDAAKLRTAVRAVRTKPARPSRWITHDEFWFGRKEVRRLASLVPKREELKQSAG